MSFIEVRDVSLKLHKQGGTKKLLDGVSTQIRSGQLMAIIGGSGSGKTTLLNLMAGRLKGPGIETTGEVLLNGSPSGKNKLLQKMSSYVMQGDFLLPHFTVRETLQFSAMLQLPHHMPKEEKYSRVEEVIKELGLKDCAETQVGNEYLRGISGGERRRVSIATQMLTDPDILFLDEPTTGLDSFTANNIVETLSRLAKEGRIVITAIHQPRSDVFQLFDTVMLLSKGRALYSGNRGGMLTHFEKIGYPCPTNMNPADHFIDISSVDNRNLEAEKSSAARVEWLVTQWRTREEPKEESDGKLLEVKQEKNYRDKEQDRASFFLQLRLLTYRGWVGVWRDKMTLVSAAFESLIMALFLGGIYYQLDDSLAGIRNRSNLLYLTCALQQYIVMVFHVFQQTVRLPVFDRERQENMYGVLPYLLGSQLAELPANVIFPFFFSLIVYGLAGLRTDPWYSWFIFSAVIVAVHQEVVLLAGLAAAVSRRFDVASLISNSCYTFLTLSCGLFVQVSTVPVYMGWIKYASFIWYAFRLVASNEYSDNVYNCPYPDPNSPECAQYTGARALADLSFEANDWTTPSLGLLIVGSAFWILTYLFLRFKVSGNSLSDQVDFSPSTTTTTTTTTSEDPEHVDGSQMVENKGNKNDYVLLVGEERTLPSRLPVTIKLEDVGLVLYRAKSMFDGWRIRSVEKSAAQAQDAPLIPSASRGEDEIIHQPLQSNILRNINLTLTPGSLWVIMGSSGSGKTSLLNFLANRQFATAGSVTATGSVYLNGQTYSKEQLKSILGYVMQDDFLLPSLTVRETLTYAAQLRLPQDWSTTAKNQRVEEVILELGLKDCADTLVGSPKMRGISGGEKRRVSIAIQMLTDPSILLLDEPTSGLDSFTARYITLTLKNLASKGRTVICTIHQPRSDVFILFDMLVVLSQGQMIYQGEATKMLSYFERLSFVPSCPPLTNPADWLLDISSMDFRTAKAERESRQRINKLIGAYQSWCEEKTIESKPADHVEEEKDITRSVVTTAPFSVAFPVLMARAWKNFVRQPVQVVAKIMQVISFGLILCAYYAPLGTDYYGIQNRVGLLQEYNAVIFIGMLNNIAAFPEQRNVFYRERADGAYTTLPFFLSYLVTELPFEILTCAGFTLLMIFAVGSTNTLEAGFLTFFALLCTVNAGESYGIAFCAFVFDAGFAVTLVSTSLTFFNIMAGFLTLTLPKFFNGINYISLPKYAAWVTGVVEFQDKNFYCTPEQLLPDGTCPITTGEGVLEFYGFPLSVRWSDVFLTGFLCIMYRLFAYLALRFYRNQHSH